MKMLLAALLAPLLMMPAQAQAQLPFDANGIANLCGAVELQSTEMGPLRYEGLQHSYQTMLADWAGVSRQDTLVAAHRKIAAFMNRHMPRLLCDTFNFNPRHGNILKLAVAKQSGRFIHDVLDNWHVDLNQVDATDGLTVLDYIRDRRARAGPTSSFGRTLDRYYNRFRAAGARHASELGRR